MSFKSTIFPLIALSSVALAANHDIQVGPGLSYAPNNTNAATGDTLTFHFHANHHDVAQGAFSSPCAPREGGFYSGFINPEDGKDVADTTFVVTVNNTEPIWFYCSATQHCQNGMVGGVNLPSTSTESLALYLAASTKTKKSTTPAAVFGGVLDTDEESSTPSSTPSGTSSPTSSPSPSASSSAGNSLLSNNYGNGKFVFHALAATFAGAIFWAGLV